VGLGALALMAWGMWTGRPRPGAPAPVPAPAMPASAPPAPPPPPAAPASWPGGGAVRLPERSMLRRSNVSSAEGPKQPW